MSEPKRRERGKPVHVAKVGVVKVPVYKFPDGRFCVAWRQVAGGKRLRETFTTKKAALERADEVAMAIANSVADVVTLTSADRDSYRLAVQALASIGISFSDAIRIFLTCNQAVTPFGRGIDSVCREWVEAQSLLGAGVNLLEVVREWNRRHLGEHCEYFQYPDVPEAMLEAGASGDGIPAVSGIYFVWNGGRVVYVGRSANLSKRCFAGRHHHAIFAGDWLSWVEQPVARLKVAEAFYIGTLKPERNFAGSKVVTDRQPELAI